jgi:hypothetical protein
MKKTESKVSAISGKLSIDPAMDKLSSAILFPAKLEFANAQLRKFGSPYAQKNLVKKHR